MDWGYVGDWHGLGCWRDLRAEFSLHDCAAYVEIYFLLCESLAYGVRCSLRGWRSFRSSWALGAVRTLETGVVSEIDVVSGVDVV